MGLNGLKKCLISSYGLIIYMLHRLVNIMVSGLLWDCTLCFSLQCFDMSFLETNGHLNYRFLGIFTYIFVSVRMSVRLTWIAGMYHMIFLRIIVQTYMKK